MQFKNLVILCFSLIFSLNMLIIYQLERAHVPKSKPTILCTTSIIADIVQIISGDTIEIISLMGPGVDPHLYKPVESDVVKIASAHIIFYNGLHLEAKLADLLEQLNKHQTTIAVTQDIPHDQLLSVDNYNQIFDPHVWFDINLWIYAVNTIKTTLIQKFPQHKKLYKNNTKKYIKQLRQLLAQTQRIMQSIPEKKRILITGHDAFSYFGRLYDCKVIALQGISTESSPGSYDVQNLIQLICDQNIPAIFIETSIPIKNILAIQEGVAACGKLVHIGGELYSDALGPQNSSGQTYIGMIMHNVKTIAQALQNNKNHVS
ncbi:MAG: zinc ABC transporter substrate-binding protein [Candidatus Chromulinivorax sp.]|nr:zinc ABC transporter substrate-binding protein [Candidatus Chromulinivorax sp.]